VSGLNLVRNEMQVMLLVPMLTPVKEVWREMFVELLRLWQSTWKCTPLSPAVQTSAQYMYTLKPL
jgi:hypothetical protein